VTVKANVDHTELARTRAQAASLLAAALQSVERAAVCVSGALDLPFDADDLAGGPRLSIESVLSSLRQQREVLVDEQSAMVDAYADSLRRAEGQR
jgi:hypothetical protein